MERREFVGAGVVAGTALLSGCAAGGPQGGTGPLASLAANDRTAADGALRQSVTRWPFQSISVPDLARAARDLGLGSVELLDPVDWPAVRELGLTCAMSNVPGGGGIPRGFNRVEHHEWLLPAYEERLREAAAAGVPNVICFSGNRAGQGDEEGLRNCAAGLRAVMPTAERLGVNVVMELLNSKVDHPDYQCDRTPWGVELVNRVGSPRFKLLYDIYHMQIMEGDVIRTIQENHQYIAHYHTAGVPGRHELDDGQELNYPAIMRAIRDTGFEGFVGQEFIPTRDPLTSLAEGVRICVV